MQTEKTYALITGATGGLGKAFAFLLAKRGDALFLTGRSEEKLAALKAELTSAFEVDVQTFAADLTSETDRAALMQSVGEKRLHLLVNAAGADIQKGFEAYTQEKLTFQCRANFEAAVSLCRFAIERFFMR